MMDGHCYRIRSCNACDRRDAMVMEVMDIVIGLKL